MKRRRESELEAELADHLERRAADLVRSGLDPAEARRRARLEFGGLEQIKEECREVRPTRWLEDWARDVRQAGRRLWRSRRFSAAASLAIALGIGANVTFFSLVHAVLLRPLPYHEPDRLVSLSEWHPERGRYGKASGGSFHEWRALPAFADAAAYWSHAYALTGTTRPESLAASQVSPNLFALLGVRARIGRALQPDDGQAGHAAVVVISEGLWQRRFASDPAIVGRDLQLDGRAHTVVGVMPREFAHPSADTDLWTPLVLSAELLGDRQLHPLRVIARLRDGIDLTRARADLTGLAARLAREHPAWHAGWRVEARPIREAYAGDTSGLLWLLQAAVAVLLLIACANVANLALAHTASREREIALRLAVGARPAHLLRQFVIEGLLLAAAGTLGGLLLALGGLRVVPAWLSDSLGSLPLPRTAAEWISPPVLLATLGAALLIGIAVGSAPLWRGLRLAREPLQEEGRGLTQSARLRRLRHSFVVAQIALAVCLLVGAGLLMRSLARLQERSFGLRTRGALTAMLVLPSHRYATTEQSAPFLQAVLERVRALPGVEAAGVVNTLPLTSMNARRPYHLPGLPAGDQTADFRVCSPQYFAAVGVPLKRGRAFEERDRAGAEGVVIVNEALARRLWPGRDPVGQSIVVPDARTPEARTVVGVVGDVRHHGLAREPEPEIYRPASQAYWPFFGLVVRTRAAEPSLPEAVRAAVSALDGDLPLTDVRWLDERAVQSLAWRRSSAALVAVFAGAAVLLAFFGVYSVVSYTVAQSVREIGVRMALGARPRDVARGFVARGAVLAGWGVGAGLALSVGLAGLLKALLFGVAAVDPATYAGVALLAILVTLAAAAVPALSAARVDPTTALRAE